MTPSKIKPVKHLAKIIYKEVGWFNGWYTSTPEESCEKAAVKILRYLNRKKKK